MSELQQDLEALLSEVDAGWTNFGGRFGAHSVRTGIGGCLIHEMKRAVGAEASEQFFPVTDDQMARVRAMTQALGFTYPRTGAHHFGAMYDWNDSQTDPNEIKLRIKHALNNLHVLS